jgi:arabinogalactan oligomer / maltooligosaccharide transport system permease protein
MAESVSARAGIAGFLSALLPGLGQLYNRQWAKGLSFLAATATLLGFFVNMIGLREFEIVVQTGLPPESSSGLLLISVALLGIAVWSIADAARVAKRSPA